MGGGGWVEMEAIFFFSKNRLRYKTRGAYANHFSYMLFTILLLEIYLSVSGEVGV